MDILYLIHHAGKAGTEKYVWDLMTAFTAEGHGCHLVYTEPGELSRRAEAAGFPTLRLDMRPRQILSAARTLAAYCRKQGISVIHAQYPRENVIAVLCKKRCPGLRVIFTSHLTIRQGPAWRAVNRLLTPGDDAVVAVCTPGAETLRQNGVCPSRIHVIFNGLEPFPRPERKDTIRWEHGLGPETFVFLTLSRLAPEKGLDFLLEALAVLKGRTDRPFVCAVAGDGEEKEVLVRRISELGLEGEALLLGYRADARDLLRSADAYVSSALYNEAMSFAILEAMGCALPLAVTDVGAGRDLSEGCGLCCAPGDVAAMAENLRKLLEDPGLCRALGDRGYERLVTEFDVRRGREALFRLYSGERA